jgi:hypothetical protein
MASFFSLALGLALLAYMASVIYRIFFPRRGAGKGSKHCMTCGSDTDSVVHTRGSIWIELVLWLCFLVPGLIYSIWRHTSRGQVCHACGSSTLVPGDSPAAVAHRRTLNGT